MAAEWRKILVSGSNAELNQLTASAYIPFKLNSGASGVKGFTSTVPLVWDSTTGHVGTGSAYAVQGGSDITTIEGNITTLTNASASFSTRVTDLETASSSFSDRVTQNETDIASNDTDITNLQTDSGSFSTRVTDLEAASASFSTRVTTNESAISSNDTDISNLTTASGSFSTRVTVLEAASASFSTRVTTNESDIVTAQSAADAAQGTADTNAGNITTIQGDITDLQTDSGSFSTRVTDLEDASGSFSTRVTSLESFEDNIVTTTFYNNRLVSQSATGQTRLTNVTASRLLVNDSSIFNGSFLFNGIDFTVQNASVFSGSNVFGSGSQPSEAFHEFTGSVEITGSLSINGGKFTVANDGTITSAATINGTNISGTNTGDVTIDGTSAADYITLSAGQIIAVNKLDALDDINGATSTGVSILQAANAAAVRSLIGVTAADDFTATLTALSDLDVTANLNKFIVGTGTDFELQDVSAVQTTLELVPGTNVQEHNNNLTNLGGLSPSANNFIVGNGAGSAWESITAETARTRLGLTSFATATEIALGTDTSGNYVSTITANNGISSNGTTSGETVAHTLSLDVSGISTSQTTIAQADFLAFSDESVANDPTKKITFSNLEDQIFANVTTADGDVTIAAGGAATIGNDKVTAGMLNTNIISGQTALTSGLVSTDELLISDNGTIKRMDVSVLQTYMQDSLTFQTTDEDVSITNLADRLAQLNTNVTIGADASNITVTVPDNLTVGGTLTVSNLVATTTVTVQAETLEINDNFIELNADAAGENTVDSFVQDSGISINRGNQATASIYWDESDDRWSLSLAPTFGNTTDIAPNAYLVYVNDTKGPTPPATTTYGVYNSDTSEHGAMYITDTGEIYIYT